MLIIGEKINSSRRDVEQAVLDRDARCIRDLAQKQVNAGATMLDVNCGTLNSREEPAALEWLVRTVQEAADIPLCIDSPNPGALSRALAVHRGRPMINSISGEKDRFNEILPLVLEYRAMVVALGMDEKGIPKNGEQALEVGAGLVTRLADSGVPVDDIYYDPLVRSVATSPKSVLETLRVMEELAAKFKGLHFVSGLSNVSYGLPERRHLNRAYVVLSIASGLDAVICDPLDTALVDLCYAAQALVNKDRFCLNYIRHFQEGTLSGRDSERIR